jgi:zinc/manganese transport system substrate-binding protein
MKSDVICGKVTDMRSGQGGRHAHVARALAATVAAVALAGCSLSAAATPPAPGIVSAVVTISAWGSVVAQLGGEHVRETTIIANPGIDPHDYEPTPADARAMASAQLVVVNGAGYDSWADKMLAANPTAGRVVVDVGRAVGVPTGGNPHRWYSPTDVAVVARTVTAALQQLDPAQADYFAQQHDRFVHVALASYDALIGAIRARYGGTPVGASESIAAPLAAALGLRIITPARFLNAISEGIDPSSADKRTIDAQIAHRQIKVYIYNRQNSTPDVAAEVRSARAHGIPVVPITETLPAPTMTFQSWQVQQLRAIADALQQAAGQ